MMGSAKAHYEGIKAFSETDFTEDLKIINVPTLVMHGDDDQIVPIADSALLSAKLLKKADSQGLPGFPARHVHHPRRYGEPGLARLRRDPAKAAAA
jgi:non-heme chloroperoxidase